MDHQPRIHGPPRSCYILLKTLIVSTSASTYYYWTAVSISMVTVTKCNLASQIFGKIGMRTKLFFSDFKKTSFIKIGQLKLKIWPFKNFWLIFAFGDDDPIARPKMWKSENLLSTLVLCYWLPYDKVALEHEQYRTFVPIQIKPITSITDNPDISTRY